MAQLAIKSPASNQNVAGGLSGDSQAILKRSRSNEIFIGVVGPAGAGGGTAAKIIARLLKQRSLGGRPFDVEIIKASQCIQEWATLQGQDATRPPRKVLDWMTKMQDFGDLYRKTMTDNAAVARAMIKKIAEARAGLEGVPYVQGVEVQPDGKPRAYVLDSLRHPAEVRLLRDLYGDAFALVGVVCDPETRAIRIDEMVSDFELGDRSEILKAINGFMERDADAPERHGQHVSDTFHQADYFVDNSLKIDRGSLTTGMDDDLKRLVDLMVNTEIVRPSIAETAMHHAHSAQLRSACLSRQVGASLVDERGDIVATGTNEVPKAGGGVYGQNFDFHQSADHRCAFNGSHQCSSNVEQNRIIFELIDRFPELTSDRTRDEALALIRKTSVGGLLEFSRAVHAEMDALLTAGRIGVSTVGTRLYVTTFPCHYCARHIISAGVTEVQYIEPYPKSRALDLHKDAVITKRPSRFRAEQVESGEATAGERKGAPDTRVLFHPFVGVAPRLYERVFLKDRDYKNKITGEMAVSDSEWGGATDVYRKPYALLEADLTSAL